MPNRKTKLLELPLWFALEKYDAAKQFDVHDWIRQLEIRLDYAIIDWGYATWRLDPDHANRRRAAWCKFMRTPCDLAQGRILTGTTNALSLRRGGGEPSEKFASSLVPDEEKAPVGVSLPTLHEFYRTEEKVPEDIRQRIKSHLRLKESAAYLFPKADLYELQQKPAWKFMEDESDLRVVLVDFSLPKQLLEKQFANLLKPFRRGRRSEDPSRSWAEIDLLPAIDLLIWLRQEGIAFTERNLAKSLFPGDEGRQDAFRRGTLSLAKSLLRTDARGRRTMRDLKAEWGYREQEAEIQRSAIKQRKLGKKSL